MMHVHEAQQSYQNYRAALLFRNPQLAPYMPDWDKLEFSVKEAWSQVATAFMASFAEAASRREMAAVNQILEAGREIARLKNELNAKGARKPPKKKVAKKKVAKKKGR